MIQIWGNASKERKVSRSRGKQRYWTEEELDTLRDLIANGVNYHDIALRLKRTELAIRARAFKLGLVKSKESWSEEEEGYLELNFGRKPYKVMAQVLGRSVCSVNSKIHRMGLREIE